MKRLSNLTYPITCKFLPPMLDTNPCNSSRLVWMLFLWWTCLPNYLLLLIHVQSVHFIWIEGSQISQCQFRFVSEHGCCRRSFIMPSFLSLRICFKIKRRFLPLCLYSKPLLIVKYNIRLTTFQEKTKSTAVLKYRL